MGDILEQGEYMYLGIGAIAIAVLLGLLVFASNYGLSANPVESSEVRLSIETENQSYYASISKEKIFSDASDEVILFSSVENDVKFRCSISCNGAK